NLVEVYTKECEDDDLDKQVHKIHRLLDKERKNGYLKNIFRSLEQSFLVGILDDDLAVFFKVKNDKTIKCLIELYVRGCGLIAFYEKIELFSSRHKISNFMDYHNVFNTLDMFSGGTKEPFLIEKINLLKSKITAENEDKIIFDGIE